MTFAAELTPPAISTPEEVTAEWLSRALGTTIRSVRTEPVGTGQIGCCVRAHVDGDGLPSTLFIKLPNPDPGMRPRIHQRYFYR